MIDIHREADSEIEALYDKTDALQSELNAALDIIERHGDDTAQEWLRLNYPGRKVKEQEE